MCEHEFDPQNGCGNVVTLVASHTDPDGDSVELYRVDWPTGLVTFTLEVRNSTTWTNIVGLDLAAARQFAAALTDLDAPDVTDALLSREEGQ